MIWVYRKSSMIGRVGTTTNTPNNQNCDAIESDFLPHKSIIDRVGKYNYTEKNPSFSSTAFGKMADRRATGGQELILCLSSQ